MHKITFVCNENSNPPAVYLFMMNLTAAEDDE